jgi:hypothetical protein
MILWNPKNHKKRAQYFFLTKKQPSTIEGFAPFIELGDIAVSIFLKFLKLRR